MTERIIQIRDDLRARMLDADNWTIERYAEGGEDIVVGGKKRKTRTGWASVNGSGAGPYYSSLRGVLVALMRLDIVHERGVMTLDEVVRRIEAAEARVMAAVSQ